MTREQETIIEELIDTPSTFDNEKDALRAALTTIREERPYWAWHMFVEWFSHEQCKGWAEGADVLSGIRCEDTGACVTEYCPTCAARWFREKMLQQDRDSTAAAARAARESK